MVGNIDIGRWNGIVQDGIDNSPTGDVTDLLFPISHHFPIRVDPLYLQPFGWCDDQTLSFEFVGCIGYAEGIVSYNVIRCQIQMFRIVNYNTSRILTSYKSDTLNLQMIIMHHVIQINTVNKFCI